MDGASLSKYGLGVKYSTWQAVVVTLAGLPVTAHADRYIECEYESGCGGGLGLVSLLFAGAIVFGLAWAFYWLPGALINLVTGRKPSDSAGQERWLWMLTLYPVVVVASIPGLLAAALLEKLFGPIGFWGWMLSLAVWWIWLWGWLNDSGKPAAPESDASQCSLVSKQPSTIGVTGFRDDLGKVAAKAGLGPLSHQANSLGSQSSLKSSKALSLRRGVNQIADRENISKLLESVGTLPVEPGYAIIANASYCRLVVVCGPNLREAVLGFIDWVATNINSSWAEFLSEGFDGAEIIRFKSGAHMAGHEQGHGIAALGSRADVIPCRIFNWPRRLP